MRRNLIGRAIGYAGLIRHARNLRRDRERAVRDNSRRHLVQRLGKLRGLPQKFGQMAGMRVEREDSAAYEKLCDSSEPLEWRQMRKVLRRAWGCPVERHTKWVDPQGFGASLGQVHKAVLHDGREVAIKIRYPGIRKAVLNDLKVLGWIAGQALGLPADANFSDYRTEILRNLDEELDYRIEARHQRRYREVLAPLGNWIVPQVVDELSNDQVLTSVWETGERVEAAATWDPQRRQRIADVMVGGFAHALFGHGVLHADPHPGNYRFTDAAEGPRIILYDFGSVTTISPERRAALLEVLNISTRGAGDPYDGLLTLGFRESVLGPVRPMLPMICRTLFEPTWRPGEQRVEWGKIGRQAGDAAGDGVSNLWLGIPAHLMFVLRAFNGLRCYADRLGAKIDWPTALALYLPENPDGERSAPPARR